MIRTHTLLPRCIAAAFAVASILYVLQAFTPLRLDYDGILYLSLADSAATSGFLSAMQRPGYPVPKGYPVFAFVLMKAHIFSSATMVLSNLALLAIALVLTFRALINLGFSRNQGLLACLVSLLSFSAVKYVTLGRSDFLFFALAACSCWLMTLPRNTKWFAIIPTVICASEVRFIGLALLAPVMVLLWPLVRRRRIVLGMTASILLVALSAGIVGGRQYLSSNIRILKDAGLGRFLARDAISHVREFAELACNIPFSKLPSPLHSPALIFGLFTLALFLAGIVPLWRRSQWAGAYVIATCCLIFPWPYTDPRFWLPVMPFLALSVHMGCQFLFKNASQKVIPAYLLIFCALGILALGYSTMLTFSGTKFAYRYGDGKLMTAYLAQCSAAPGDTEIKTAARLLERYQWHCNTGP